MRGRGTCQRVESRRQHAPRQLACDRAACTPRRLQRLPPDATSEWSYNYNQCFGPLYDSNAAPTSCSEECRAAFQARGATGGA